jgi:hypothetical protein
MVDWQIIEGFPPICLHAQQNPSKLIADFQQQIGDTSHSAKLSPDGCIFQTASFSPIFPKGLPAQQAAQSLEMQLRIIPSLVLKFL